MSTLPPLFLHRACVILGVIFILSSLCILGKAIHDLATKLQPEVVRIYSTYQPLPNRAKKNKTGINKSSLPHVFVQQYTSVCRKWLWMWCRGQNLIYARDGGELWIKASTIWDRLCYPFNTEGKNVVHYDSGITVSWWLKRGQLTVLSPSLKSGCKM